MNSKATLLLVVVSVFGCSASGNSQLSGGSGDSGGGSGAGGGGGSSSAAGAGQDGAGGGLITSGAAGSGAGSGGEEACSEAAKLIYVLSEENNLYSFKPDTKAFKKIGRLNCPAGTMSVNSMAVDRSAAAWVNYVEINASGDRTNGAIFKVSTVDASCEATKIKLGEGWYWLGMGFSTDTIGGSSETLFIAGTGANRRPGRKAGLGKIDFSANSVSDVGEFTGSISGEQAELTGTGDARLFGFFSTSPVQLAELNKESGTAKSSHPVPGVTTPASFAFSFWGGDFYLYTAPQSPSITTTVSRYRPSDRSVDPAYMKNIGFRIIGAGVSTCAPIEPPR